MATNGSQQFPHVLRLARTTLLAGTISAFGGVSLAFAADGSVNAPTVIDNGYKPVQVVVSLNEQRLKVYRGSEVIASSNISSGKSGHNTPTGIFSILSKRKRHFSNIYNNAPMPYMQRLTWTGIALHGSSSVPRRAASHGCVRLPYGFDKKLFSLTRFGGHVLVTGDMEAPKQVRNPDLPGFHVGRQYDETLDHWRLRMKHGGFMAIDLAEEVAQSTMLQPVRHKLALSGISLDGDAPIAVPDGKPVRILFARDNTNADARSVQEMLASLGHYDGEIDGAVGPVTRAAIRAYEVEKGLVEQGRVTSTLVQALANDTGRPLPANGKVIVRKDGEPVYSGPINIVNVDQPLGTHLLVAQTPTPGANGAIEFTWNAYTLENALGKNTRALMGIEPEASEQVDLSDALARIEISDRVMARLESYMTTGSSIAIADAGVSRFTGWKTDFIVNTRVQRSYRAVASSGNSQRRTRSTQRATSQRSTDRIVTGSHRRNTRPNFNIDR